MLETLSGSGDRGTPRPQGASGWHLLHVCRGAPPGSVAACAGRRVLLRARHLALGYVLGAAPVTCSLHLPWPAGLLLTCGSAGILPHNTPDLPLIPSPREGAGGEFQLLLVPQQQWCRNLCALGLPRELEKIGLWDWTPCRPTEF